MKLLYCSRDYTTHDERFVRLFTSAGFEVAYVRLESDGVDYAVSPLPSGARFVDWRGGGEPRSARAVLAELTSDFADVVRRESPDVVHAGPVQTAGALAAAAGAHPFVLVSWGSDVLVDATRDAWWRATTRAAVESCDAFFCDAQPALDSVATIRPELPPHLCVPWGPEHLCDPRSAGWRQAERARLGWTDAAVVVASRAWHRGYRVPELVTAFAHAHQRTPNLRLVLLGDGGESAAIRAAIVNHRLEGVVHTPGMLTGESLWKALAAGDVYLSLVPSDGTSISLLEAMANGLAPIVVDNPGNRPWVSDGNTGWLVSPDDLAGFSIALVRAFSQPDLLLRVQKAATARVRERANWLVNSQRILSLYRDIARKRG